MEERLENIKKCADERSELSLSCLNNVDLSKLKNTKEMGKARFFYDKCVKENSANYPCIANKIARLNNTQI